VPEAIAIIDRARDAAEREAWAEAYELFGMLDRSDMSPTDLAALADAAWWKARRDEAIAARLEAYTGFDHLGDHRGAASAAIRMFFEHFYVGRVADACAATSRRRAKGHRARPSRGVLGIHGPGPR
jgi:hypothetical protein